MHPSNSSKFVPTSFPTWEQYVPLLGTSRSPVWNYMFPPMETTRVTRLFEVKRR